MKSMIFQFMTRFDSKRWIDLLPSLIANYNGTLHSATRQKPADVMANAGDAVMVAGVYARLKKRAERTTDASDSGEEFAVGDTVRVLLTSEARRRKNQFEKKIAQNWTDDLYVVRKKSKPSELYNRPTYLLRRGNRNLTKRYYNYHLLKVDPNALVPDLQPVAERPVFDAGLFDNEKHLRTGKIRQIKVETRVPEKTALEERKARAPRVRKANKRYS